MDTSLIAILIYLGLCLKIALMVFAVYYLRLPSSKAVRKLEREGGQRQRSAREGKTGSRPVLKSSSGRAVRKRVISSGEKPLKPALADIEPTPETLETWKSAHSQGVGPWSGKKRMPVRNKPSEQIEPVEARTQVQPSSTAPAKNSEPGPALRYDSVRGTAAPDVPRGQSSVAEPVSGKQIESSEVPKQAQTKGTAPVKGAKTMAASKDGSVRHTAFLGPPQPQAAFTVSRSGEKPSKEPLAGNAGGGAKNESLGNVEPDKTTIKENEPVKDIESGAEENQSDSESSEATTDSNETDQEASQKQKSGLGDLSDLFATSAADFSEKNKLAEQVTEVDVNEILQEGLGLLGKVKKSDD